MCNHDAKITYCSPQNTLAYIDTLIQSISAQGISRLFRPTSLSNRCDCDMLRSVFDTCQIGLHPAIKGMSSSAPRQLDDSLYWMWLINIFITVQRYNGRLSFI